VRRAGGRIRVTAQLIAAADGAHVWSERYDRELSDIFAVQDEISSAIAGALRLKLSGAAPSPPRYKPKLEAYEAYLKAKHQVAKVTPESLELSKASYERAIALDPAFGLAHVGVGYYWLTITMFGLCPPRDGVPAARAAVRRALEIDASIPEAHALLGYLAAYYDRDFEASERHFSAPLAKQAGLPIVRPVYSALEFFRGNVAQAIALAERAIEEDPLEVWPRMNLHAYLQAADRDRDAYEQTLKVLALDPNLVVARVSHAHFHAVWGERREALAAAREVHAVGPWYPDAIATLAAVLRVTGDDEESRGLYQSLGSGTEPGSARAQAVYYLLCGDVEAGADWAEKAIAERDHSIMYYMRFAVATALRASRRWPAIARMINLPSGKD
jgi:serine/threonine-protein kinase